MKRLEGFGTRNTFSETDNPTRGIGAARNWIVEQFQSYSPRMQIHLDRNPTKRNSRVWRDVEVVNVVAVLKGKVNPERQVIVSGHYDSSTGSPSQNRLIPTQALQARNTMKQLPTPSRLA